MYECKNLNEAIWFRLNEIELQVINDGRVTFYVDEEQENYNDIVMDYLAAKQGFRDISCSYTKLLEAEKWVKNKIHENK